MSVVIQVEHLSKYYRLGLIGGGTLREDVNRWWAKLRGQPDPLLPIGESDHGNRKDGQIWALRDINLEVKQGEILGIIGRNGAGKSTLLKILSRITAPTEGRVKIKGRVGSLLEVGTGFHPELTGRENIYLNGTILGMTRPEVSRKLDEIVEFAEMAQFIDTPVKRYSSGMTVRLAFAVAAHLEPEILIIDEVLAVGDAAFQKKCLGKMGDVANQGRTILFVSHQMASIENLCTHCLVLKNGRVAFSGLTKNALGFYLQLIKPLTEDGSIPRDINRSGSGDIRLTGFRIEDAKGNICHAVASGSKLVLAFDYEVFSIMPVKDVSIGFSVHTTLGDTLAILYSDYSHHKFSELVGIGTIRCYVDDLPLSTGRYLIGARILGGRRELDWPKDPVGIVDVEGGDFYGTGCVPHSGIGPIMLRGDWRAVAT
ncbi:MAG: ABC transporter ATP-binding protein [Chromatiaceae bacterium]|nr:ABC transporter ATP-binding protein [Chromatiaceae bacterium]